MAVKHTGFWRSTFVPRTMTQYRVHKKIVVWIVWFCPWAGVRRLKHWAETSVQSSGCHAADLSQSSVVGLSCTLAHATIHVDITCIYILFSHIEAMCASGRGLCLGNLYVGVQTKFHMFEVYAKWYSRMQISFWRRGWSHASLVPSCSSFPLHQKLHAGELLLLEAEDIFWNWSYAWWCSERFSSAGGFFEGEDAGDL